MKKALVVGINYEGTGNDLRGCINDANNIGEMLAGRGFDVELMLEKEATTAGIKAGLARLVKDAVPGDVVVFHYSGHGSQLPSKVEEDGFEEIICPIDLNWTTRVIADKDLKAIFDPVPNGVNVTLILDCCHSGTGLNQNESLEITRDFVPDAEVRPITGPVDQKPRFLPPPAKICTKLEDRELVDWQTARDVNASALLIAGSRADQTSADAYIDGTYQGAATAAILKTLKENRTATYRTLVYSMTDYMIKNRFTQRPQLDGFSGLYDEVFAEPFGSVDIPENPPSTAIAYPPAPVTPGVVVVQDAPQAKENDNIGLIVVLIIVVISILVAMS